MCMRDEPYQCFQYTLITVTHFIQRCNVKYRCKNAVYYRYFAMEYQPQTAYHGIAILLE
jgi:hypothetical protein